MNRSPPFNSRKLELLKNIAYENVQLTVTTLSATFES